jgi:exopolyphosphatase / guanosine-5'-triphosphate,3'-diphosphate pyrophosphatase
MARRSSAAAAASTDASPPPAGPVAVIDIGSNSARIVVYRLEGGISTQILASSRGSLRLVRELDATHRLSEEAIARAFEALQDFRAIALGAGAARVFTLATAAVRDAENGHAFIADVKKRLALEVRILSGEEEARYGFLGAVGGLPVEHGVLFDVGGGSMQVTRFRHRRLTSAASLPLGSLRLSDSFLKSDPPAAGEIRRLCEHARSLLQKAGVTPLEPGERVVGTGGTIRNLAKVDRRAREYPVTRLHGYVLPRKGLREVVDLVSSRKAKRRAEIPGLNEDRGDSIVGGGLAIRTLLDVLQADEVCVSGQGVREGLARSLMAEELLPVDDVRRSTVRALCARFVGWDEESAERRVKVAEQLLLALELSPDPDVREGLFLAALVLDVGRSVDFFDRHEHVADIVLATDLLGFTHRGVALLSAVLRAAGDEDAEPRSYAPLVNTRDEAAVRRAGALLTLADAIEERCPRGVKVVVDCRVQKDEVVVKVEALAGWRPRTLGRRFERAFGRRLSVVPG